MAVHRSVASMATASSGCRAVNRAAARQRAVFGLPERAQRNAFCPVTAQGVATLEPLTAASPTAVELFDTLAPPMAFPTSHSIDAAFRPGAPTPQETAELESLFDKWNAALQSGNPEEVARLYAPDAILLPTVSNKVRTDHESKVDYFTAFLQIKPYGTVDESYVRFLHPAKDIAANSGVYTFRILKDGKEQTVTARYSFIYRKFGDDWKIVEHHSSAMPEAISNAEIAALFDTWNGALQTGDADKVADLYADDAILLPTVSNQVRTTRDERVDYFKNFMQLRPYGTINISHIRFISPTIAANSGVYTFRVTKDGKEELVSARYSFVYRKVQGQWKIIEHHSSAMPEKGQPAVPAPEIRQKQQGFWARLFAAIAS